MKYKKSILFLAILFGLVSVFGVNYLIRTKQVVITEPINYKKVVTALNDIPAHVVLTAEMVSLVDIPEQSFTIEMYSTAEEVVGATTNATIYKGETLSKNRLITEENKATSSLAYRIPENMRAVSVPVNEVTGVAGYINEGDRIDLVVSYKAPEIRENAPVVYTQFQNLEVLAVGHAKRTPEEQNTLPNSLTLLVRPEQAEVLSYAMENGSLQLTLRNPADETIKDLQFFNSETFDTYKDR